LSASVIETRLAHVPHGEWDAWAYWQIRASFLSAPEGWRNVFQPGNGSDYPLMLPAAVARVWVIAGYSPAAPAAISVVFTVSTAALLVGALWRRSALSAAAGAGLLLVPEFLFHGTGQCADIPLAYFALAGGIALSGSCTIPTAAVSGMALGLAAWTKNEGLVVAVALPVAFALASWHTGKASLRPLVIGLLVGTAPALVTLLLYHFVVDPPTGLAAGLVQTSPVSKLTDWSRHQTILQFVAVHTARWGLWLAFSPVWIVAAWTTVGMLRRRGHPAITAGRLTVVAMLAATYLVYVLTPYDLGWHLLTSWTRIVAQVWPLAVWTSLAWIGCPRHASVFAGSSQTRFEPS
jgi:hypothetical protein